MLYNKHKSEMIKYMKSLKLCNENRSILVNAVYSNGYIPECVKNGLIEQMDKNKRILCESYVYYI